MENKSPELSAHCKEEESWHDELINKLTSKTQG